VRVCSVDDRILIREANSAWEVESGQAVFEFSGPGTGDNVAANAGSTHAAKVVNAGTAEYWFDRGLGCDQSDAYDNAAACYRRALKLDPEHINSHINLGRIRHAARAYAEAEGLYRSALALEPGNAIAAFNIGVALEDQGRLDEALDLYRRAARSDPNLPDAHYNLARLLELRGDKKKASHHLRRFYALTGNNSD
jgi:tetratricopeptide (TPR) repeat protein